MLPLKSYGKTLGPVRNHLGYVSWEKSIQGFRQKPPFNIDTEAKSQTYKTISGVYVMCNSWDWNEDSNIGGSLVAATNMARAKFVSNLGDASSFGATATAERKETFSMVVSVITKCALAAKQVSRMQLSQAARTLGLPFEETTLKTVRYRRGGDRVRLSNGKLKRRGRAYVTRRRVINWGQGWHAKTLASGWLMWSYGVKPLASDIYNGMDILQRPMPESLVRGSGRGNGVSSYSSGTSYWARRHYQVAVTVRCSAYVRVNNPNLWLCNQLGLVNPVQWFNEGIPFSFVVDWFSNLSQVISQMTDFVGLDVMKPCQTRIAVGRETFTNYDARYNFVKEFNHFVRTLSIPVAKFQFAYERFEWQRGLNAISLLIGFTGKR